MSRVFLIAALGLNGLYFNLKGRERQGAVEPGAQVISSVHSPRTLFHGNALALARRSRIADRAVRLPSPQPADLTVTILNEFGVPPAEMKGPAVF